MYNCVHRGLASQNYTYHTVSPLLLNYRTAQLVTAEIDNNKFDIDVNSHSRSIILKPLASLAHLLTSCDASAQLGSVDFCLNFVLIPVLWQAVVVFSSLFFFSPSHVVIFDGSNSSVDPLICSLLSPAELSVSESYPLNLFLFLLSTIAVAFLVYSVHALRHSQRSTQPIPLRNSSREPIQHSLAIYKKPMSSGIWVLLARGHGHRKWKPSISASLG